MPFQFLSKMDLNYDKSPMARRLVILVILLAFLVDMVLGPVNSAFGQTALPLPGSMVNLSSGYEPTLIKGMRVYPDNPLRFDFIIDPGKSGLQGKDLELESTKLMKYFLSSLTVPDKDMWVNLSPYEKDRIIPEGFGKTEMGRDMLGQDYILKQLTASLIYPEHELGKSFWTAAYQKARELFGTTDVAINTFNKIWIVPEKAVVYSKENVAYVVDSHLKVMLEEDYLAMQNSLGAESGERAYAPSRIDQRQDTNKIGSQVVRQVVLPAVEKEVNEGRNFAPLRQVYHSLILATWFKRRLKESLLSKIYVGKNKIEGVTFGDSIDKDKIYADYLEAFKKGAYNFIKEEEDALTGEMIPRKYFSGGVSAFKVGDILIQTGEPPVIVDSRASAATLVAVRLGPTPSKGPAPNGQVVSNPKGLLNLWQGVSFGPNGRIISFYGETSSLLGDGTMPSLLWKPRSKYPDSRWDIILLYPRRDNMNPKRVLQRVEAINAFRDGLEITQGNTLSKLYALGPLVDFMNRKYPEDKRFWRYFEIREYRDFSRVTEQERQNVLDETLKQIKDLPDEMIHEILMHATNNIEQFLDLRNSRLENWNNVDIDIVINADDLFVFTRTDEGRYKLTLNLFDFLYERKWSELLSIAADFYFFDDEIYISRIAKLIEGLQGGQSIKWIEENQKVVLEILRILDIMRIYMDQLYGVGELAILDKSRGERLKELERDVRVRSLMNLTRELKGITQEFIAQDFSEEVRKLFQIDAPRGERTFELGDTNRRIMAILSFIKDDPDFQQTQHFINDPSEEDIWAIQALANLIKDDPLFWLGPVDGIVNTSAALNDQTAVTDNSLTPNQRRLLATIGLGPDGRRIAKQVFLLLVALSGMFNPLAQEPPASGNNAIAEAIQTQERFPPGVALVPRITPDPFEWYSSQNRLQPPKVPNNSPVPATPLSRGFPTNNVSSKASTAVGGINLDTSGFMINEQGERFSFDAPLDPQILQNFELNPVNGLVPVILQVVPIGNLSQFLSFDQLKDQKDST